MNPKTNPNGGRREEAWLRKQTQRIEWHMAMLECERGLWGIAVGADPQARLWQRLNTEFLVLIGRLLKVAPPSPNNQAVQPKERQ